MPVSSPVEAAVELVFAREQQRRDASIGFRDDPYAFTGNLIRREDACAVTVFRVSQRTQQQLQR